jgi:hypothetical protein
MARVLTHDETFGRICSRFVVVSTRVVTASAISSIDGAPT